MAAFDPMMEEVPNDWSDFVHTGPGTLAGRYLRMFWQPVYISNELPAGQATTFRLLSEDFTLYRGTSGTPHLLQLRCAHRATQLNTGWVEGDEIRCFYHGWKYDGSGQCTEQPGEPEPFCERIRIKSYPVQEYLGFIFAYLGEGEAPPLPRYADLEEEGGEIRLSTYDRNSSYFQSLENTPDHVHVYFVHYLRRTLSGEGWAGLPRISAAETDWGIAYRLSDEGGEHLNGMVWPNIARRWNPNDRSSVTDYTTVESWTDSWAWRVPIDDWSYRSFNLTQSHGQRARNGQGFGRGSRADDPRDVNEIAQDLLHSKGHVDEYLGHPNAVNIQDCVSQNGQGAITDRSIEHLGRSDAGIIMLRQLWTRELRALAEGRPLKQWGLIPARLRTLPIPVTA
jgi:5,5'-dehydrodivanillate O-demethylase